MGATPRGSEAYMVRNASRSVPALQLEALEVRALLSGGVGTLGKPDPTNSIIVRFLDRAPAPAITPVLNALKAHLARPFPDGPTLVVLGRGIDPASAAARLRDNSLVAYAEPDS